MKRHSLGVWLIALTVAFASAARADPTATRVLLYTISDPYSGRLRPGFSVVERASGVCWTGSIAAVRPDAWRCMVGNEIHDPCYSTRFTTDTVYCPKFADLKSLLAITLTKPLPTAFANKVPPSSTGTPAKIILPGGTSCGMMTGATSVVAGMRINYGCSDGRELLGNIDRAQPTWRIYAMKRDDSSEPIMVDIDAVEF